VKDLFTCQEVKSYFLLAWFTESDDNVVEYLSSKAHLTDHKAKERILTLSSNYHSASGASSKNSKPQNEAKAVSLSNGKKDKKKKKGSSSFSNSGGTEYNWCRKRCPGIWSGQIWIQYKELKARRDRNGAETSAPVQKVTITVSPNSSKWIVDSGASSHMTPDRNCFESFLSVRGNVLLPDKTQVEYTGVGSVRLSGCVPSRQISVLLWRRVPFVPSLRKSW
jgi:hypothetical protein